MKYTVDKQEKYTVLQIQEENLNAVLAPELKSLLVVFSNENVTNLILDLSQVKFVDSSGLSAILTADRIWKHLGIFILTGIEHPHVQRLIQISQLESVLTIIPTVSESIDYVFMEEIHRELDGDSSSEEDA